MSTSCNGYAAACLKPLPLTMKAVGSSNMLAPIYQTMWFHKPRDSNINTLQMGFLLQSHEQHLLYFQ